MWRRAACARQRALAARCKEDPPRPARPLTANCQPGQIKSGLTLGLSTSPSPPSTSPLRGWWVFCLRVFLTMQRRQFTQSLVAASTVLLLATSSRAVGVQDPMDAKSVTIGCSKGTTGALARPGQGLKQRLDAGIAQAQ